MLFISPLNQRQTNRCIYIFADNPNNASLIKQVNILKADPNGVKQRLVIYQAVPWSAATEQQYKKWKVPNVPFTVILIGRDNGEKLRSHEPVTLAKLFDLIDNMQMRREETKIHYKN